MSRRLIVLAAFGIMLASSGRSVAAQAVASPDKVFRYAAQQDVATLDPYGVDETFTTGFLTNKYEQLVR